MRSSFLNKIKYKKERVGVVEKDGKTYVKYIKTSRFVVSGRVKYAIIGVFVLVVLGLGIKLLMSELSSMPPVEAAVEGMGE